MTEIYCQLLIIGGGPGGYVCGIRAGQLGIDAIVVEESHPGGTCLNVGCIPSKALIHAADEYHKITSISKGPLGITTRYSKIDLAKTIKWKNGIVSRLNQGVSGLLKKAGTQLIIGSASFLDGKTVQVNTLEGTKTIRAENVVIATGSTPIELPILPFGGKVISSTEALAQNKV
uniref:FAD-dependent oxidoreductase n=1 Tax=Sneathiella sp. TaxID=1964365 RepID=UPI003565CCA2